MLGQWLGGTELSLASMIARLCLSVLACGLVGFEREAHRQTAGWRTHIIIGLGATLAMLLSIWIPRVVAGGQGDPGRIAAQVVSGMGFLGAGAFIKVGNNVKGMTTAATIWFVAGLGLAIGAGMWQAALVGLGLGLVALIVLEPLERKFFPTERLKTLQIWYDGPAPNRQAVRVRLLEHGIVVHTLDASLDVNRKRSRLSALASVPVEIDLEALFDSIKRSGKVSKIRLHEDF